jgi:hypothetical protein
MDGRTVDARTLALARTVLRWSRVALVVGGVWMAIVVVANIAQLGQQWTFWLAGCITFWGGAALATICLRQVDPARGAPTIRRADRASDRAMHRLGWLYVLVLGVVLATIVGSFGRALWPVSVFVVLALSLPFALLVRRGWRPL